MDSFYTPVCIFALIKVGQSDSRLSETKTRAFCTFVTFVLILDSPADPSGSARTQLSLWATFLGVSSAVLAALQYAPQIVHTYRLKLVGALSVPMMMIQTPGGFIMAVSIMIRSVLISICGLRACLTLTQTWHQLDE